MRLRGLVSGKAAGQAISAAGRPLLGQPAHDWQRLMPLAIVAALLATVVLITGSVESGLAAVAPLLPFVR
jgi:hypothetical protein